MNTQSGLLCSRRLIETDSYVSLHFELRENTKSVLSGREALCLLSAAAVCRFNWIGAEADKVGQVRIGPNKNSSRDPTTLTWPRAVRLFSCARSFVSPSGVNHPPVYLREDANAGQREKAERQPRKSA